MISLINFLSVIGVATGVAALIIVISVMNGFDKKVKEKIIGTYSHIVVFADDTAGENKNILSTVTGFSEVQSAAPFILGQIVLRKDDKVTGVLLKGVNLAREKLVTDMKAFIDLDADSIGPKNIILGKELMESMGLSKGDKVELIMPRSISSVAKYPFTVRGAFESGRFDYDSNIVIVDYDSALSLYERGGATKGLAIKLYNENEILKVKAKLNDTLGMGYMVKSWMDLDRNLISALAVEKRMMFVILGIIVLVACFNISSSLIMVVMEKTRDIGILKAIGATSLGVSSVFFIQGLLIGLMGSLLGAIGGVFIAERVNKIVDFIKSVTGYEFFPSDVYYFNRIPVEISHIDVSIITSLAIALSVLAGLYPAWKASRMNPVEAIRYE